MRLLFSASRKSEENALDPSGRIEGFDEPIPDIEELRAPWRERLGQLGECVEVVHLVFVGDDRTRGFFIDQVGLFLSTRWVVGDIQPNLEGIRDDQALLVYGDPECRFR